MTRTIRILLFLTAAAVLYLVVANWPKATPPNDADLRLQTPQIPAESNAFWPLLEATIDLYWPESLVDQLDELSSGRNWDESLANDILEKNQACLTTFEQSFQSQWLVFPHPEYQDEGPPYLTGFKRITKLECLRTAWLFHAHKEKEAFDEALKILEFGHRLENAGGDRIHYLVGATIKEIGLRRIREMTAQTTLQEAELLRILRALDRFGANQSGLTNALKAEFQMQCRLLDDIAACRFERLGITNSPSEQLSLSNELKHTFNVTKTRAQFARTTRALLRNIPEPFCQTSWPEYSQARTAGLAWLQWAIGRKHNAEGDRFFYITAPSLKKFFQRKSQENVSVRATQLLLALKIHVTRHRQLPASLAELTPEFFPQVPLDDFDGKPMRYLPAKKLLYSVGPDLQDSAGQKSPQSKDSPFEINF